MATPARDKVDVDTTSSLTSNGIQHTLSETAPSLIKSANTSTIITDTLTPQNGTTKAPLPQLDASLLRTTLNPTPRPVPLPHSPELASQTICTDHMITVSWTALNGWAAPSLQPFGPLSLMPTASCLNYATQCFEGMKLYRGHDGKLRLFRPQLNCNRMLMSTTRIALPAFPPDELLKLIAKLCATDGDKWLPKDRPGTFLYIRPSMIASDPSLGVQRPKEALLYVVLTCSALAAKNLVGGMRLLASKDDMCRAWPGGFGYAKVGANYGPSLVAQGEAITLGYHQILWLFGEDCTVTEAGASNFFVVWRTREGTLQLVTAGLEARIVLDGVTRRSILELAREKLTSGHGGNLEAVEVVERTFGMVELEEAASEGRLVEAFAAGTAWFVTPVGCIHFRGKDIEVPMVGAGAGRYTAVLKGWLRGIMWGCDGWEGHEWGYVVGK
ncbi:branched-chain-amino-acid aminotransferase [Massariosphaeria phaeospora]|uniref:Branched-chain-amino-acid aminotransferase n=1 Tax=Massariosphaeria phaeospora TaxID=100035 RepID=A0A7C8IER8_9PLEO|nr:branched-chain-amino-acid aminotransferase [Massariosphaeria phaeospora]